MAILPFTAALGSLKGRRCSAGHYPLPWFIVVPVALVETLDDNVLHALAVRAGDILAARLGADHSAVLDPGDGIASEF